MNQDTFIHDLASAHSHLVPADGDPDLGVLGGPHLEARVPRGEVELLLTHKTPPPKGDTTLQ